MPSGFQNGFMSPNDVRSLENMNPIPEAEGGDTYMVNGNMLKLKDVGAYIKEKQGVRRIKRFWNWINNEAGKDTLPGWLHRPGELV